MTVMPSCIAGTLEGKDFFFVCMKIDFKITLSRAETNTHFRPSFSTTWCLMAAPIACCGLFTDEMYGRMYEPRVFSA
jgi:hypothetical protein